MNRPTDKPVPREWTEDEIRAKFVEHAHLMAQYWASPGLAVPAGEDEVAWRVRGALFSLLVVLDGESAELPSFVVSPSPHPDDREYHIKNGQNYYPEAPTVHCDIAGSLHEKFSAVEPRVLGKIVK